MIYGYCGRYRDGLYEEGEVIPADSGAEGRAETLLRQKKSRTFDTEIKLSMLNLT